MALSPALMLALPGQAMADCDYLTEHFELCIEGTPWANGRWESGGDSATLYLGDTDFEGFEDYYGKDPGKTIAQDLKTTLAAVDAEGTRVPRLSDRFRTSDLTVVRSIDIITFDNDPRHQVVQMIARAKGQRISMIMNAPPDMPLDQIEKLSREMAGHVRPRAQNVGN